MLSLTGLSAAGSFAFIYMFAVEPMKVAVIDIINVIAMHYGLVTTIFSVLMFVEFMRGTRFHN